MQRSFPLTLCLFLLTVLPLLAAPTPVPPPPPTLAQALVAAPPHGGLVLAVSAEGVSLPSGVEMPAADASAEDIATAFACRADTFGVVTAVSPATKVALNTNPALPNVSADLSGNTAFKMLAASLDDSQWKTLTSDTGLGLTDLTDATQKALFHGLFRQGHLWVASQDPELAKLPDDQRTDIKDMSDQIDDVRLRLGQTAHIYLHDTQGKTIFFSAAPPNAAGRLHTWYPRQEPQAAAHNVLLRAVVPNTPTDGDLHPDAAAFRVNVSCAGANTVNDLMTRIAAQTHQEIYADPHYAARALTILGPVASAPAGDLLRGLAQAVAGTYRQVGPAFVLTDDLAGVGTRRQRLAEWEEIANTDSSKLRDEAGQILLAKRLSSARRFPTFSDPLALTPEEMAAIKDDTDQPGVPSIMGSDIPFTKLTPSQQTWGRQTAEEYEAQRFNNPLSPYSEDAPGEPDMNGSVTLLAYYQIQLLVPGLTQPVHSNILSALSVLYFPGEAAAMETLQQNAAKAKPPTPPLPPAPPLAAVLHSRPRRAILGHPRTPAEVDALVAAMRKIGLNELWLDVFSEGVAHIPNSPLSAKSIPVGSDILAEALTQTQGTGIRVYADMSLLPWGEATPDAARDRTIEGETNAEAAVHAHERNPDPNYDNDGKLVPFAPPPISVSPASSQVRQDLISLVGLAAAHTGLAGFVWEDAEDDDTLGYAPEMRLAFLRSAHADPLDISPTNYLSVDASLPTFDNADAESKLSAKWTEARQKALIDLLKQMRRSFPPPAAGLPILMEQSAGSSAWMASWDDLKSLPPPLRPLFKGSPYPSPAQVAATARTQGKAILLGVGVVNDGDTDTLARDLKAGLEPGWRDGYVLDFRLEDVTQGKAPLDALVRAVLPKQKH